MCVGLSWCMLWPVCVSVVLRMVLCGCARFGSGLLSMVVFEFDLWFFGCDVE